MDISVFVADAAHVCSCWILSLSYAPLTLPPFFFGLLVRGASPMMGSGVVVRLRLEWCLPRACGASRFAFARSHPPTPTPTHRRIYTPHTTTLLVLCVERSGGCTCSFLPFFLYFLCSRFSALEGSLRSARACADFRIQTVRDCHRRDRTPSLPSTPSALTRRRVSSFFLLGSS